MKTRIKDSFDTFVYGKDSKGRICHVHDDGRIGYPDYGNIITRIYEPAAYRFSLALAAKRT